MYFVLCKFVICPTVFFILGFKTDDDVQVKEEKILEKGQNEVPYISVLACLTTKFDPNLRSFLVFLKPAYDCFSKSNAKHFQAFFL